MLASSHQITELEYIAFYATTGHAISVCIPGELQLPPSVWGELSLGGAKLWGELNPAPPIPHLT